MNSTSQPRHRPLEIHTECIYEEKPIEYLALFGIETPRNGGEIAIYDARCAALLLLNEAPELAVVTIRYGTGAYPGRTAAHPIIYRNSDNEYVLRIRMTPRHNHVLNLPPNWDIDAFYDKISAFLERSHLSSVRLTPGNVLYLNNRITLHSKLPHRSLMNYVRVRIDDPNNFAMKL